MIIETNNNHKTNSEFNSTKYNSEAFRAEAEKENVEYLILDSTNEKKQNIKRSWITTLKRYVFLKPYGDELLSSSAAQWILSCRIIILLIASSEATSWGYAGTIIFQGWNSQIAPIIIGIIVFLIIWVIDVSLVTLDRSKSHYQELFGNETAKESSRFNIPWLNDFVGIIVRIVAVAASLLVTTHFFALLVYNGSIEAEISRIATTVIHTKRDEISKKDSDKISNLQNEINELQNKLPEEVAGRPNGISRKKGDGAVAKTMRSVIAAKQDEMAVLKNEVKIELDEFNSLVEQNNFKLLGEKFGVIIPQNNITERSKVLKGILETEEARRVDTAIKVFVSFLFTALLLLKIFEPRGTRIYFSEAIQQAWDGYKNGAYDRWVPADEKWSGKSPMSPFRFEDFMMNTYAKRRKEDEKEKTDRDFLLTREKLESILHHLRVERDREIERIKPHVTPLLIELEELKNKIFGEESILQSLNKTLLRLKENLKLDQSEYSKIEAFMVDPTIEVNSHSIEILKKHINRAETLKNNISSKLTEIELLEEQINNLILEIENFKRSEKSLKLRINEYEKKALSIERSISEIEEKAISAYAQKAENIAEKLRKNGR